MLLATEPDMEVVGEAEDGLEAVEKAAALNPDVILMDLVMPEMDGIEATRRITASQPEIRILVLTSFAADDKVFPAVKAGALGYLLKDSSPEELLEAIHQVHRGEPSLEPSIARKVLQELSHPSKREAHRRPAHRARAGGPAPDRPGHEQQGDRRQDLHRRVDGAHPREQHPGQAAPGQPHPGGPVRAALGSGLARRCARIRMRHKITLFSDVRTIAPVLYSAKSSFWSSAIRMRTH